MVEFSIPGSKTASPSRSPSLHDSRDRPNWLVDFFAADHPKPTTGAMINSITLYQFVSGSMIRGASPRRGSPRRLTRIERARRVTLPATRFPRRSVFRLESVESSLGRPIGWIRLVPTLEEAGRPPESRTIP